MIEISTILRMCLIISFVLVVRMMLCLDTCFKVKVGTGEKVIIAVLQNSRGVGVGPGGNDGLCGHACLIGRRHSTVSFYLLNLGFAFRFIHLIYRTLLFFLGRFAFAASIFTPLTYA